MLPEVYVRSGQYFNILNPNPSLIFIRDIASSLSKLCRFTGHGRLFYSVAEHSVNCACLVPKEFRLEALLHDAAEAYLGDVSSPLKALLPEYQRLETSMAKAIASRFDLPETLSPEVKKADLQMLKIEKEVVLGCFDNWEITSDVEVNTRPAIRGWIPSFAEQIFLEVYYEATACRQRRAG